MHLQKQTQNHQPLIMHKQSWRQLEMVEITGCSLEAAYRPGWKYIWLSLKPSCLCSKRKVIGNTFLNVPWNINTSVLSKLFPISITLWNPSTNCRITTRIIPNHALYWKLPTPCLKVLTYRSDAVTVKMASFWFLRWKMASLCCQIRTDPCDLLNFFYSFLWCSKSAGTLLIHLRSRSLKSSYEINATHSLTTLNTIQLTSRSRILCWTTIGQFKEIWLL